MTLSDLASIGSFVSGLSVLATGIYLAVQMRQAARHQRAMIHHDRTQFVQQSMLAVAAQDMMPIWMRGGGGDQSLDEAEVRRYIWHVSASLHLTEEHFYLHKDGMLDNVRWKTSVARIRAQLAQPGFRAGYQILQGFYQPDFKAFIEDLLQRTPPSAQRQNVVTRWKKIAAEEAARAQARIA